jgi:hypothetical protein
LLTGAIELVTNIKLTPTAEEADVLQRPLWSAGALFVVDRSKWPLAGNELPQQSHLAALDFTRAQRER